MSVIQTRYTIIILRLVLYNARNTVGLHNVLKHEDANSKQLEKRAVWSFRSCTEDDFSASPSEGRIHYLGGVGVAIVPGNRRPASRRDRCRSRTHALTQHPPSCQGARTIDCACRRGNTLPPPPVLPLTIATALPIVS